MPSTVPVPSIRQVFVNSELLSGTGRVGDSVIVTFADGSVVTARVNEFGSWVAAIPQGVFLSVGDYVTLVQVNKHGARSKEIVTVIRPETEMPILGDIVYVIYQNDFPINNEVYTDFFRAQAEVQCLYGVSPVNPNQLVPVDYARDVIIRSVQVTWEDGDAVIIVPGYTIIPSIDISVVQPEIFKPPSNAVNINNSGFYGVKSILWKAPQRPAWNPNSDLFQPKTFYSVYVELQADEGYTFYGVRPWLVQLNYKSPVMSHNNGDTVTLRYDFPALPSYEVSNFNILADSPGALRSYGTPVMEHPNHAEILEHHWQTNEDNPYGTSFGTRIVFELQCFIRPNHAIEWEQHNKPGIFTVNGDAVFVFYLVTDDGVFVHYKFVEPE